MKEFKLFSFILIFLVVGRIQSFNITGTCEQLSNTSLCSTLKYNYVYIPSGTTQAEIESDIVATSAAVDFATTECKPFVSLLYCLSKFQKCNTINETTPQINLPSFPCNSICEKTYSICTDFFTTFLPTFTCSSKNSEGMDEYPVNETIYNLAPYGGSPDQEIPCNDGEDAKIDTNSGCPDPLVFVPESKRKDQVYYFVNAECAIPCPFKVYTEEQYTRMRVTKIITYALSFGSSIYLIFVFGILPNKLTQRMEIILSFSIGGFFVGLAYYMEFAGTKEYDDFICSDEPGRYIFETDPSCGFNGTFFHFGLLTSVIWWGMICYDFYLTMNIKRNEYYRQLRILAWGIPLICTIAPLAGMKFGASLGSSGCWLTAGNKTAWPYLTFYAPIWMCIVTSFYFLAVSMKKIYQTYKLIPSKKVVLFNIRTMGFMLWVLFAITFGCFNNFYLDSKSSLFLQQIYDYFFCLTENKDNHSLCSVSFPFGTFRLLNIIATSTTGIAGFLGLGLDPIVKELWVESTKVNYLIQVIKNTHFYSYVMLRGNNNYTASTNSSSYGNTGTNLTSEFSTVHEKPVKPKKDRKTVVINQNEIEMENMTNPTINTIDEPIIYNNSYIDNYNNNPYTTINSSGRIIPVIYENPTLNDNNNINTSQTEINSLGRVIPVIYEKPPSTQINDNNNNSDTPITSIPVIYEQPPNQNDFILNQLNNININTTETTNTSDSNNNIDTTITMPIINENSPSNE